MNSVYYAMDVETSGLSPARGDRVIEYAVVKISRGEIVAEYSTLINAPCEIHFGAQRVHGITRNMLNNQPEPVPAWQHFLDFVGKAPLIAHNARFDMTFIRHELTRLEKGLPNKNICTLRLARKRYPHLPTHTLEAVARYVLGEIPAECRLHRALGDARLVAALWLAMEGIK